MIHTLTLNPAIDRTYVLTNLTPGGVSRASHVVDSASGKGVNVLRVASTLAAEARAIVLLGGPLGAYFQALCEPTWSIDVVPITHNTRLNVSLLVQDEQRGFKINEEGPQLSEQEVSAVVAYLDRQLGENDWLAICGSTPSGVDGQVFLELRDLADARGAHIALDVPNLSLAQLLDIRPRLFKPNLGEFEKITGYTHTTIGDVVENARAFSETSHIDYVIVTLGSLGAVISKGSETLFLPISNPATVHPVGAGDAVLAGFLTGITRGQSWQNAFALGVAASYILATASDPGDGFDPSRIDELAASLGETLRPPTRSLTAIQL